MRRVLERRRHFRFAITLRCLKLGLEEKEAPDEVGASQIGISEVGSGQIGHAQVRASQASANEAGPSQIGPSQIGAFEVGSDEVGSSVLLLAKDAGAGKFAGAQQQRIDALSVGDHIQCQKCGGTVVREPFGLFQPAPEFSVERAGRW